MLTLELDLDPDEARAAQRSVARHALFFCGFSTRDECRTAVRGERKSGGEEIPAADAKKDQKCMVGRKQTKRINF